MTSSPLETFQVDLRGVVDLLGQHLYSGPRVYLRELLQNGVDAITARRELDDAAPATIRLRPFRDGGLAVTDSGIGLTVTEARELLATVGRSSKRDDLGLARTEFLGQFGIGLLSAFMVADVIELLTRSARQGSVPVLWRGNSDGSFRIEERSDLDVPVGTTVWLRPRQDMDHWVTTETVTALATEFGELLAVDLAVEVPVGMSEADFATEELCPGVVEAAALPAGPRPHRLWRRLTEPELPWLRRYDRPADRNAALARYCRRTFGFEPLDTIDLAVPLAGVTGVAFVLPEAVPPGASGADRVYLKRMLMGARVEDLLPEWAFFVRCVVDASGLRPTASRETLYVDEVLLATQEALAAHIRTWVAGTLRSDGHLARAFIETHHLAVRSLALSDDTMLDLATEVLPFETTDGPLTLNEVVREHGSVRYTPTLDQFRRVAPVARAQGMVVVNAGYVYDSDLLGRLGDRHPDLYRALGAEDISQVLSSPGADRLAQAGAGLTRARTTLEPLDCEPVLRVFNPSEVPAILLSDRDGEFQRDLQDAIGDGGDPWSGVLETFIAPARPRRLVLNDANEVVRQLLTAEAGEVTDAAVRTLYVQALLMSGQPLRSHESTVMTEAMSVLIRGGIGTDGPDPTREDRGTS
jgi:molecular chaperone HtpG